MPYTETHTLTIGPITLPAGVKVTVLPVGSGEDSIVIEATVDTSKDDAQSLLESTFAIVMTAAAAEGVGTPVFQVTTPAPAPSPVTP